MRPIKKPILGPWTFRWSDDYFIRDKDGKIYTSKDWRMRAWPAGANVKKMKKIFSRKFRRLKLNYHCKGNLYRKYFCHYDINDFK